MSTACRSTITIRPPGQDPIQVPIDEIEPDKVNNEISRSTKQVEVSGVIIERITSVTFAASVGTGRLTLNFRED